MKRFFLCAGIVSGLFLGLAGISFSADYQWTGDGNGNWNNVLNWDAGLPPSNNTLVFDILSVGNLTNNNDFAPGALTGVSIRVGSPASPVTINGNAFSPATTASSVLAVDLFNATQDLTINAPLVLTGETAFLLPVSGTRTLTVNGDISGAGSLVLGGDGTVLTGTNSYSGGTTLTGNAWLRGNTTSLQGNIANGCVLWFDQTADGTYGGIMSGVGELIKTGAGILTLTGANTSTGKTTVYEGAIRLGGDERLGDTGWLDVIGTFDLNGFTETIGSLSGNGTVQLGSGSLVVGADNTSTYFIGTISGTGTLEKIGTGTLNLFGANTYSGGTTVSAGTLQGDTASLQGDILNNSIVEFNQAGDGAYAGAMSGTGALHKSGAGTLTLFGANTYSGGTTVSAGALQGDSTSLQGYIINNSIVEFNQAAAGTYAGVMSGTGELHKSGAGTLSLTGSSTFTGGTRIGGGTIRLGGSERLGDTGGMSIDAPGAFDLNGFTETIGSLSGNGTVQLGSGSLIVGANNTSTLFDGTISGAGNLEKIGTGTLTLTGANTYSGGTTVSAGTLQGDTASLRGNIVNNAAVVFDQSAAGTYSDVISGSGSLRKTGTGDLTLTGIHSYSGGTIIDAGALWVNGVLGSSNVTINSGGVLGGNGSVRSVTTSGTI